MQSRQDADQNAPLTTSASTTNTPQEETKQTTSASSTNTPQEETKQTTSASSTNTPREETGQTTDLDTKLLYQSLNIVLPEKMRWHPSSPPPALFPHDLFKTVLELVSKAVPTKTNSEKYAITYSFIYLHRGQFGLEVTRRECEKLHTLITAPAMPAAEYEEVYQKFLKLRNEIMYEKKNSAKSRIQAALEQLSKLIETYPTQSGLYFLKADIAMCEPMSVLKLVVEDIQTAIDVERARLDLDPHFKKNVNFTSRTYHLLIFKFDTSEANHKKYLDTLPAEEILAAQNNFIKQIVGCGVFTKSNHLEAALLFFKFAKKLSLTNDPVIDKHIVDISFNLEVIPTTTALEMKEKEVLRHQFDLQPSAYEAERNARLAEEREKKQNQLKAQEILLKQKQEAQVRSREIEQKKQEEIAKIEAEKQALALLEKKEKETKEAADLVDRTVKQEVAHAMNRLVTTIVKNTEAEELAKRAIRKELHKTMEFIIKGVEKRHRKYLKSAAQLQSLNNASSSNTNAGYSHDGVAASLVVTGDTTNSIKRTHATSDTVTANLFASAELAFTNEVKFENDLNSENSTTSSTNKDKALPEEKKIGTDMTTTEPTLNQQLQISSPNASSSEELLATASSKENQVVSNMTTTEPKSNQQLQISSLSASSSEELLATASSKENQVGSNMTTTEPKSNQQLQISSPSASRSEELLATASSEENQVVSGITTKSLEMESSNENIALQNTPDIANPTAANATPTISEIIDLDTSHYTGTTGRLLQLLGPSQPYSPIQQPLPTETFTPIPASHYSEPPPQMAPTYQEMMATIFYQNQVCTAQQDQINQLSQAISQQPILVTPAPIHQPFYPMHSGSNTAFPQSQPMHYATNAQPYSMPLIGNTESYPTQYMNNASYPMQFMDQVQPHLMQLGNTSTYPAHAINHLPYTMQPMDMQPYPMQPIPHSSFYANPYNHYAQTYPMPPYAAVTPSQLAPISYPVHPYGFQPTIPMMAPHATAMHQPATTYGAQIHNPHVFMPANRSSNTPKPGSGNLPRYRNPSRNF